MKDIIITVKRQKKEILIFAICFLISFIINAISIVVYDTQWKELFTYIGYVAALSVCLYAFLAVIRLIIFFVRKLFKR